MSGVTFQRGVALSSSLAGPIVVTPPMLLVCAHDLTLSPSGIAQFLVFNFFACVVGLFCSMIPNIVGATALAGLGLRYSWARWPVTWGASGATLGWIIQLIFAGNSAGPWDLPYLAIVGGTCALICRSGTRWSD